MPKKEKVPNKFQMLPFPEVGSYLCRFPGSEIVWTCPMLKDGSMDSLEHLGEVEFHNIDESDAMKILALVEAKFPRPRLCYGAQAQDGAPDCDGPSVHRYSVRADNGRTFETSYCSECAAMAPNEGLTLTRLD